MSSDIVKKMKLLDEARSTLLHFSHTDWNFPSENFDQITSLQSEEDSRLFPTNVQDKSHDDHMIELVDNFEKGIICMKKYKMNENPDDVDKARRRVYM